MRLYNGAAKDVGLENLWDKHNEQFEAYDNKAMACLELPSGQETYR